MNIHIKKQEQFDCFDEEILKELWSSGLWNRLDDGPYVYKKLGRIVTNHFDHPVQENANLKIVQLLLDNGANINQKYQLEGETMTPYAVARKLSNLIQILSMIISIEFCKIINYYLFQMTKK